MATATELAEDHHRLRAALARRVEAQAAQLWATIDPANLTTSWATILPALDALLVAAQQLAAGEADAYLAEVLAAQDIDPAAVGSVRASRFSGVASDGRALASLLAQPVITTKQAIASGATVNRALLSGQASLRMIVGTQVADAGRTADQVSLTARRTTTGYVRVAVGKTCSRCLVLSGKFYAWNTGFQRHPKCDCVHLPTTQARAAGIRQSPRQSFDALSREEQDQVFGKTGAEAIRDGADVAQVVNARRGMYTAGIGTQTVQATREGVRKGRVRLMPEQIYREARGDRAEAIRLLRLHGYLT